MADVMQTLYLDDALPWQCPERGVPRGRAGKRDWTHDIKCVFAGMEMACQDGMIMKYFHGGQLLSLLFQLDSLSLKYRVFGI